MSQLHKFFRPTAALLAIKVAMILPVAMLVACSSSGGYDVDDIYPPGETAGVQIVGGNNQTAIAGTELPAPLVGKVTDIQGHTVANRPVTFVVASGGGSLSSTSVMSDVDGLVQSRWTLGAGAGTQKVEVRAATGSTLIFATFEAVATAGAAANATPVAGTDGQAARQSTGLPAPVSVSVVDLQGNAKAGVTVAFTPCDACGSVDPSTAVTNAGGIATSAWTLGAATGAQELSARVAGLPEVHFHATATSTAPGPATSVAGLQGDAQSVDQHGRNAQALRVFVTDSLGNGVPGVAVDFAPGAGGASFTARTINTGADGVADFSGWFHEAGIVRVEASVGGIPPATFDLTVVANEFDFDGSYTCRFAHAPDAPYVMSVHRNEIVDGGIVSADGTFLHGRIDVGFDGSASANGTAGDAAAAPMPWTCERR
jgi:hypothetical protein